MLKLVVITLCCAFGLLPGCAFAIQDYCSLNTFATNGSHMQFTKEPSVEEFAIVGKFKGLHCCAKGYRSIEWYKDGKPYPWPLTQSQLILYPESANQTVYTKRVTEVDAGKYTCLLRNDSVVHSHTIQLVVFEKIPDDPKITYLSQNTEVALGNSFRLFCEAFAGHVDLPDAHNEAVWRKVGRNGALDNEPRIRQKKISREDGQTFGTYLIIENARKDDFGEYICKISKPGKSIEQTVHVREKLEVKYLNPNRIPVAKLLLIVSAILFLTIVIFVLSRQYALSLKVHLKDSYGSEEGNDGKSNDVLILHAERDSEIAVGVLQPALKAVYNYNCEVREYPLNISQWFSTLQDDVRKTRRIIAVLSPAVLNNLWTSSNVYQALKQLQGLGPKLICITLAELPFDKNEVKNSQGETLQSLSRMIPVLFWQRPIDDKFWLSLRLRLPPKRENKRLITNSSYGENSSRLTSVECSNNTSVDNYFSF